MVVNNTSGRDNHHPLGKLFHLCGFGILRLKLQKESRRDAIIAGINYSKTGLFSIQEDFKTLWIWYINM